MKSSEYDFWIDFTNPPHVNLFVPIKNILEKNGYSTFCTAREFVETKGMLNERNIEYLSFGKHGGKNKISKALNLINRNIKLVKNIPDFSICISSSFEAAQVSKLKNRNSIFFDDNEIAPNWLYSKFINHLFTPIWIDKKYFRQAGVAEKKIFQYPGFKEEIYIADYTPNRNFLASLPFDNYVVVRPENIKAAYVPVGVKTIVPELVKKLNSKGINVVYLPRYESDRAYIQESKNIHIPETPVNGLDLCYYSEGVFTGAGTIAREAAILGRSAFSFFAGKTLLQVDQKMIAQKRLFHSRDADELISFFLKSNTSSFEKIACQAVRNSVVDKILQIKDE